MTDPGPEDLEQSLTLAAIRDAARIIGPRIHRTPLLRCRQLSERTGFDVRLKDENCAGVLAASAGNHAQGLAYAAATERIPVKVVMPAKTPAAKIDATRSMGAEVILHGDIFDDALAHALEIRARTGMVFVHPAADPHVVCGAGTVGLEICEDLPEVDAIVCPVGGGGLISGIATAAASLAPRARVFGVNPERADAMARSFREGKVVRLEKASSIAEGMAGRAGTPETLGLLRRLVADVVTVGEASILEAILLLLTRAKILAEGAGAGPLAALLERKIPLPAGSTVVLVVSGGHLDLDRLSSW